MDDEKNQGLQSVTRACNVLECISKNFNGITAKEISSCLNVNLSTIYHIIKSLQSEGFVEMDNTRKYYLGYKIGYLYRGMQKNPRLISKIRPYLEKLNAETKETVYLVVYRNYEITVVDSIEGLHPLKANGFSLDVGYSGHAYARASGKILLAHMKEKELEEYLKKHQLIKLTPKTITDVQELRNTLKKCREDGYAVDYEEFYEGMCCVAVPVLDHNKNVIAAIAVSFPVIRKSNIDEVVKLLLETKEEISHCFSF